MPDLLWADARNFFDPDLGGALPDARVPGATADDWQAVLDPVQAGGWTSAYSVGEDVLPLSRAEEVLSRPADAEQPYLRVNFAPGASAVFRSYAPEEVDSEVDHREWPGQERPNAFCAFLSAIGRQLSKPVQMHAEGDYGHPVLGLDVATDRVVLLADPQ